MFVMKPETENPFNLDHLVNRRSAITSSTSKGSGSGNRQKPHELSNIWELGFLFFVLFNLLVLSYTSNSLGL